ncbi:MAG: type II toxin-antitoxin system PemK/MazF family toxin [Propionibacteriaceae bacterium]|jgi:mRNA interferase MazF|nr:type II toxin-antitoxin system PemK/MazF family toxin [Propionibacteriaceae bacterium]
MVIERGQLYWHDFEPAQPGDHTPAKRRPVLVVQSDPFNASKLATATVAVVTTNTALASLPGNVFLPRSESGLPKDSAVVVSQLATVKRYDLAELAGALPRALMQQVDAGLRLCLGL